MSPLPTSTKKKRATETNSMVIIAEIKLRTKKRAMSLLLALNQDC
jgi:hypothetical protein